MKVEKKQDKPHRPTRMAVRYLLIVLLQCPLLDNTGLRNWYKNTVPVGRSLMRLPTPDNVLSLMVFWEPPLDLEEDQLAAPIGSDRLSLVGGILVRGN